MNVSKTSNRTRWNRDELLIVLNLYHKLRFGQFDQRQPVIIDLALKMGRTPSSIAMKLSNLASLDPVLQLRGIKGLKGASNLDRAVWEEYHTHALELVPQGQHLFEALFADDSSESVEVIPGLGISRKKTPTGETERLVITKQRRGQQYFREVVLNNYDGRCAITSLPIRELLIASHILPWSGYENERLSVRNGICLNRLHDAAFDQGLIAFDDQMCLLLSARLHQSMPNASIAESFAVYERKALIIPTDGIHPDPAFLANHRKKFGFKK